ncbi:MAG TPA: WYL domain-containing protein [Firmicutes bacterium]|jgi:predicted DNA-binding transcriptional regulator YafY|nr:WYL domain-containing protein [Bacillota bacterium]
MNHGKTPARELSQKFEVSVRTIQRDIDSLCQAGIPIVAETGANGGYYLEEDFRMDAHTVSNEDYSFILTSLKGFYSAMKSPRIISTLEKVASLTKNPDNTIILDFSVLREGDNQLLQILQDAIHTKCPVRFEYTNADNITRIHNVEPIAVVYRWYSWYLLAYSVVKNDYRTYKLIRMRKAKIVDAAFTLEHRKAEEILHDIDKQMPRKLTEITVYVKSEARAKAVEYLNGTITREYDNNDCDMVLNVIENEHLWFGMLLSLGDGIEVKAPEHIRNRVLESAKKMVALYQKL